METFITVIKEHIECKNQIFKLAMSDILRTYRGAALGWLWAIIKPSIFVFVMWFAISMGLRSEPNIGEHPFILWLMCGLIPWFYMSEMLGRGMMSIKKYNYLVTKMKFPVSTIPTFVSISKITINIVLMSIVVLIFALSGFPPSIYAVQIPFYFLCSFLFFTLYSLCTAPLAVISKDFSNIIKSFITPIFWLSGVLWDPDVMPLWFRRVLLFNPVTFISRGFRDSLVHNVWFFSPERRNHIIGFFIMLLIMFCLAMFTYGKSRKEIPDVL